MACWAATSSAVMTFRLEAEPVMAEKTRPNRPRPFASLASASAVILAASSEATRSFSRRSATVTVG